MDDTCSNQIGSVLTDIFGKGVSPNVSLTQEDTIHWVPVYRHFKPALLGAISNIYTRTINPEFTEYIRQSVVLASITGNASRALRTMYIEEALMFQHTIAILGLL